MWFATPSSQWTSTTYSLPVSRRTLFAAFSTRVTVVLCAPKTVSNLISARAAANSREARSLCAQHVRLLGSESLLFNLMEVKD
jgi:hypothetical protein